MYLARKARNDIDNLDPTQWSYTMMTVQIRALKHGFDLSDLADIEKYNYTTLLKLLNQLIDA